MLWDEEKNPEGRWRVFCYEDLVARDKCSLGIFWLKNDGDLRRVEVAVGEGDEDAHGGGSGPGRLAVG